MKQQQWLDLCAWMCDLWPHAPIEPSTATAWWPFIADRDAVAVRAALAQIAMEPGRRFPPSIGDIVAHLDGSGGHREWADEVWDRVLATINGGRDGRGWRATAGEDGVAWIERCGGIAACRDRFDPANPWTRREFDQWAQARFERRQREHRAQLAAGALRQLPAGDR